MHPGAKEFLQPQTYQSPRTKRPKAKIAAMGHQLMLQRDHLGGRRIELIAQVAGIANPQDARRGRAKIHFRQAHKRQGGRTDITPHHPQ